VAAPQASRAMAYNDVNRHHMQPQEAWSSKAMSRVSAWEVEPRRRLTTMSAPLSYFSAASPRRRPATLLPKCSIHSVSYSPFGPRAPPQSARNPKTILRDFQPQQQQRPRGRRARARIAETAASPPVRCPARKQVADLVFSSRRQQASRKCARRPAPRRRRRRRAGQAAAAAAACRFSRSRSCSTAAGRRRGCCAPRRRRTCAARRSPAARASSPAPAWTATVRARACRRLPPAAALPAARRRGVRRR